MERLEDRTLLSSITGFSNGVGWMANNSSAGQPRPVVPIFSSSPDALELTDGQLSESSSAFYTTPQPIGYWSASFTYLPLPGVGGTLANMADGVTFVLQNQGPSAVGPGGIGLGYAGITSSVAIKLDLHDNQGEGPNSTGIYFNGALPTIPSFNLTGTGIDLHSGHPITVVLNYNGTALTESLTDQTTTVSYSLSPPSYTTNLVSDLGSGTAYVGFTGATGLFDSIQSISNFVFAGQSVTQTALTSSPNPSAMSQSVTFTATVNSAVGPPPAGDTVNFFDGTNYIGSGTLDGSGTATLSTSSLTLGANSITAVYGGDANFVTSTSPVTSQTVGQGITTTIVSSSANPSEIGQPVTFTATVNFAGGPPPAGETVNFFDGTTKIGSGTLNGMGQTTFSPNSLALGTHSITAVYVGDANYLTSTSPAVSQVVNPLPTVTLGPATLTVSALGGMGTITVTLSAVSTLNTAVTLGFSGTAVLGTNFDTSISGSPLDSTTLTIPAGSLTGQVTLIGKSSGIYGPDLQVTVSIASAMNGTPGGGAVQVTIANGLAKPVVSLAPATSTLAEMGGSATFAATLNEKSSVDTTLTFGYAGSAVLDTDFNVAGNNYVQATQTLVIPAGSTMGLISVYGLNNQTFGPNLTAVLTIASAINATISASPTATATITEGSPGPAVTLSVTGSPMSEAGGLAVVTASIPKPPFSSDVFVNLMFTGSAVAGVNYAASGLYFNPTTNILRIPSGATSSTVTLAAIDDGLYGPTLNAVVSIQSLNPGITPGGPVTVQITNGDPAPSVSLGASASSFADNGGQVTVTATLTAASGFNTVVPLTFGGTAAYGANYRALGQNYNANTQALTIPAGQTSESVVLTGQPIGRYGPALTVLVGVGPTGPPLVGSSLTELITESSPPPQVTLYVSSGASRWRRKAERAPSPQRSRPRRVSPPR